MTFDQVRAAHLKDLDTALDRPACYPSVEADGDGYILRLDGGDNWHWITPQQARRLCSALLTDGPGAERHILQITIG